MEVLGFRKRTLLAIMPVLLASCALTPQAQELRHPELMAQRRAERERELSNPTTQYILACEREVKKAWEELIRTDRTVRNALHVEPLQVTVTISLEGSVEKIEFLTNEPSYSKVLAAYRRVLEPLKFPPVPEEVRKEGKQYVQLSVWFQGQVSYVDA